jgi:hypothetical protein
MIYAVGSTLMWGKLRDLGAAGRFSFGFCFRFRSLVLARIELFEPFQRAFHPLWRRGNVPRRYGDTALSGSPYDRQRPLASLAQPGQHGVPYECLTKSGGSFGAVLTARAVDQATFRGSANRACRQERPTVSTWGGLPRLATSRLRAIVLRKPVSLRDTTRDGGLDGGARQSAVALAGVDRRRRDHGGSARHVRGRIKEPHSCPEPIHPSPMN